MLLWQAAPGAGTDLKDRGLWAQGDCGRGPGVPPASPSTPHSLASAAPVLFPQPCNPTACTSGPGRWAHPQGSGPLCPQVKWAALPGGSQITRRGTQLAQVGRRHPGPTSQGRGHHWASCPGSEIRVPTRDRQLRRSPLYWTRDGRRQAGPDSTSVGNTTKPTKHHGQPRRPSHRPSRGTGHTPAREGLASVVQRGRL